MSYNDLLDSSDQIDTEEAIAALIFDYQENESGDNVPDFWPSEEDCADMGRRILALVLTKFRDDLIADSEWRF